MQQVSYWTSKQLEEHVTMSCNIIKRHAKGKSSPRLRHWNAWMDHDRSRMVTYGHILPSQSTTHYHHIGIHRLLFILPKWAQAIQAIPTLQSVSNHSFDASPNCFGLPAAQPGDERRSSAGAKQVSANCFTMMWQQDSNYKQYFQFQTVEGLKANVVEVAVRLFDPLMKGKNGKANWPHTTLALVFHWIESVFACPRACCHHVHLLPSNSQDRVNKSH